MTHETKPLDMQQVDQRIAELRDLLQELEQASNKFREQKMHAEIDHLEEHFEASELDIRELSLFKEEVMQELKALLEKIKQMLK